VFIGVHRWFKGPFQWFLTGQKSRNAEDAENRRGHREIQGHSFEQHMLHPGGA